MIKEKHIRHAEYVIDTSNAVETLVAGLGRSKRGRPTRVDVIRLLLIGLYLSISHRGNATISAAHAMLATEIAVDQRIRLGVSEMVDGLPVELISIDDFYSTVKMLCKRLAYTVTSAPEIDDDTRAHRHGAIRQYCDSLMDLFLLGPTSHSVAIDATGIWSWGRWWRGAVSDLAKRLGIAVGDPNAPEDPIPPTTTPGAAATAPTELDVPVMAPTAATEPADADSDDDNEMIVDIAEFAVPTKGTKRLDVDAAPGVKTKKSGGEEVFFGYHEHTVVAIADFADDDDAVPALIRRFELTSANTDIVRVTLSLIDRSPVPIEDIVVDRHYSFKKVPRWRKQLELRGIVQHLDLRVDEHGFEESDGIRWAGGCGHCPATPDQFGTILRPAPNAAPEDKLRFAERIADRKQYAMRRNQRPGPDGKHQVICPALAGSVGCSLRPGTETVAIESGLRIVENPPNEARDGEPLPKCCVNSAVLVTPPPKAYKLQQTHYWGSAKWERMWNRRIKVESSYGIRKNPNRENVRRGHSQVFGLVWMHIVMGLVNASFNTRMLALWCERHPDHGLDDHPLLAAATHVTNDIGFMTVTPAEYAQIMETREDAA